MLKYDLLMKNGQIIDGTGNSSFEGDIGIKEGKIIKIGDIDGQSSNILDAKGLAISPGFIDMHNHADLSILTFPNAESYIMQGITTSLVGNCGFSFAPINPDRLDIIKNYLSSIAGKYLNVKWDWRSSKEYFEIVSKKNIAINIAYLTGHGTLRIAVKGLDNSIASKKEIDKMKMLLEKELEEGSFGLSTGLFYPPGSYSNTEEIVELTSIFKKYHALYTTHMRSESDELLESVEEAIQIGEKNDIPVEISHHKALGKMNWGKVKESMRLIENARQRGLDINCDVYPYTAANTTVNSLLPPWTMEGGINKMLARISNHDERLKIKREIMERRMKGENWIKGIGWENIVVSDCPLDKEAEGKSLKTLFQERNQLQEPFEALFDWLIKINCEANMIFFAMDEDDVKTVISNPLSIIISDSWPMAPNSGGKPHPRTYGTFPRVLSKYVREEKVLTLEEAIRKMTSLPAKKIGLIDRGILREGYQADIVVFNPEEIKDMATFENPHQYPKGIYHVIVNGKMAVENGNITGLRSGKILKRQNK